MKTRQLTPQMAEDMDAVLISIRTRFVRSILAGTKTFELRKTIPRSPVGKLLVIYSSGEDRAITAYARVGGVISGAPQAIWERHGLQLGLEYEEFNTYFEGSTVGYALQLEDVTPCRRHLTLHELRSDHALNPPQSWRYLPRKAYQSLLETL